MKFEQKGKWRVDFSSSAKKLKKKLPVRVAVRLANLSWDLEHHGPIQPDWSHYGPLRRSKNIPPNAHHCHIRPLSNLRFCRFLGSFEPNFDSNCGGYIDNCILPPQFKSKFGQNNPKNRRTLNFERGLLKSLSHFFGTWVKKTRALCFHKALEAKKNLIFLKIR